MIYAGLDIGTTGTKITLFDGTNELITFYEKYNSKRTAFNDEIDANIIFDAVIKVINEAIKYNDNLGYIGVTSFGETFVLLDKEDNILLPSILYNDVRGKDEVNEINKKIGEERVGKITGLLTHEMYSLPKLLYIKNNYSDVYNNINKILLIEDFIVYKLTGIRQIDYSLASRTMLFDINKLEWSDELFDAFNLDKNKFSIPVKSGTIAGNIKKIFGFSKDIKIISVSHDQFSVAIGSGLTKFNDAIDGCGTCECFIPLFKETPTNNKMYKGGFGIIPYSFANAYISYPLIFSGGALIEWFINNLCINIENPLTKFDKEINTKMPSKLLISPHFLGSGTPYMNSYSLGNIYGLNISSTLKDIYQGILEGVAYEMLLNIEILKECGIKINHIYANGGGSKNENWLQIKTNILNIPITKILNHNAGTVGSAIIVGTTIGEFNNIDDGIKKLVKFGKTYYPDKLAHKEYMKLFKLYKKINNKKIKLESF
ncbi:MAG: FGGY family carbohydrate kinase [Mollicutes bacterium]|nr:FGGY family carbohydrate kinase [Mollicutes bacterium]MDD7264351.1 FGGY family carbohydrate kinase [bacterium]MDY4979681.1 FGGY-family carbohydrate kinase [Candidatus Onthovivens sp.]